MENTEQRPITCFGCKFYVPDKGIANLNNPQGTCRRMPPQVMVVHEARGTAIGAQFPVVKSTAWCGEHVPKLQR